MFNRAPVLIGLQSLIITYMISSYLVLSEKNVLNIVLFKFKPQIKNNKNKKTVINQSNMSVQVTF